MAKGTEHSNQDAERGESGSPPPAVEPESCDELFAPGRRLLRWIIGAGGLILLGIIVAANLGLPCPTFVDLSGDEWILRSALALLTIGAVILFFQLLSVEFRLKTAAIFVGLIAVAWTLGSVLDPMAPRVRAWLGLGALELLIFLLLIVRQRHARRIEPQEKQSHEKLAQLQEWIIPLSDFRFYHEPYRRESSQFHFIGRERLVAEFLALLKNSENGSGSYLITGYRGAGKTSLVKKVLHDNADGRRHLNLSEKYDFFGPFLMRCWDAWQRWRGGALLALHCKMVHLTKIWRKRGRPAPRFFFAWPPRAYWLFFRRILYSTIVGSSVLILLAWNPQTSQREINWTAVLVLLLLLSLWLLAHQFLKHRFALFNPSNWLRWLRRPAVVIHINLGHERLEPKKILFGLVHLLRVKYREPFGMLSPATLVRVLIFLLLSLVLSLALYDLFRSANERLEQILQDAVFSEYAATRQQITRLFGVCDEGGKNGVGCAKTTEMGPACAAIYRVKISEPTAPADTIVEIGSLYAKLKLSSPSPEQKRVISLTPLAGQGGQPMFRLGDAGAKPGAGDGGTDEQRKCYARTLERSAWEAEQVAKALRADEHRARRLCDYNDGAGYSLTQSLYCSFDSWIVAAYCHAEDCPANNSKSVEPRSPKPIEAWFRLALKGAINAVQELSERILPKERGSVHGLDSDGKGGIREFAPRPYNILFFLVVLLATRGVLSLFGRAKVIRMLDYARERIVATDNVEVGGGGGPIPLVSRRRRQYEPLDVRQAEAMILDILEANRRIPRLLPRPEIVFVFDELDKINPIKEDMMTDVDVRRGRSLNEAVRRRKVEVEELLSNLKNLITVAPCRFIFIAGREMMDANLADQTASSHLYSSLFDKVIYVPSFLTDTSDGNADDISSMVEQYVCRRLLRHSIAYHIRHQLLVNQSNKEHIEKAVNGYECWSLDVYAHYLLKLSGKSEKAALQLGDQELMTVLQDFVYYLTYRSGGNPKKLALHFERFVVPLSDEFLFDRIERHRPAGPLLPTTHFMLCIPPPGQYEIQLISQVFLLFHGDTSALIRNYGDKLAVATFSILDYLSKFHSSGFNSRDLERMPDVLDINRAPALPQLIRLLLERILAPYLRRVDNGLYEYRFLLHYQREVVYISQFSEQELAAFNFTLDESISIKQHFRSFRDEQIRLRKELVPVLWPESAVEQNPNRRGGSQALPYIDNILGDLHSLDKEHDLALTEYRNVLDGLAPVMSLIEKPRNCKGGAKLNALDQANVPFGEFILFLRTLLKSGLIYEQRRQFDHAAAAYQQAKRVAERIMQTFKQERPFSNNINQLYLIAQPYISLAFLYAKCDEKTDRATAMLGLAESKMTGYNLFPDNALDNWGKARKRNSNMRVRLRLRRAELLLFRSNFEEAACWYADAARHLVERIKAGGECDAQNPGGDLLALRLLGDALSGLGDACAGMDLRRALPEGSRSTPKPEPWTAFFKSLEDSGKVFEKLRGAHRGAGCEQIIKDVMEILSKVPYSPKKPQRPQDYTGRPDNRQRSRKGILECIEGRSLTIYALAAAINRLGGKPSKAALSLWKGAYLLSFGLSYWRPPADGKFHDKFKKEDEPFLKHSWKNSDLPPQPSGYRNRIHEFSMESFRWAYRAHQLRLRKLKVVDPKILKWTAPPLSQSLIVLGAFWSAFSGDEPNALDELAVGICDMGAFPVYPRILAAFLKGRWRFQRAFPNESELPPSLLRHDSGPESGDNGRWKLAEAVGAKDARYAFRFFVDAAEQGAAYEGGMEMLNPPLALIYYHLWLVVFATKKAAGREGESVLSELEKSTEFQGERQRFFDEEFVRTKAKTLLREMLARHGNDEGFFAYAEKHYYLADSFSDPYVNGLWAVHYGLLPIASDMLKCLCCPPDTP